MNAPLILIGGGGHCRSVIEAAESAGLKIAGILDLPRPGVNDILGYPVLGDDSLIPALAPEHEFVITVGFIKDCSLRRRLAGLVIQSGGRLATVVASSAVVSRHASIGPGTVVLHHSLVNAGAAVGSNCIINSGAIVEHDAAIGDDTHVSTTAVINGGASIGTGVFIGSNTTVNQGLTVVDGTTVASGSLVAHSIAIAGTYKGLI